MTNDSRPGPHQGQPILTAGQSLDRAAAVMILVHGRGASAQDILTLVPDLAQPRPCSVLVRLGRRLCCKR